MSDAMGDGKGLERSPTLKVSTGGPLVKNQLPGRFRGVAVCEEPFDAYGRSVGCPVGETQVEKAGVGGFMCAGICESLFDDPGSKGVRYFGANGGDIGIDFTISKEFSDIAD
jgi:hypothetical protein